MSNKSIVDQSKLCPDVKIQVEQDKIFGKRRGIDNKPIDDVLPTYDAAQSEKVIPGYNNNFIILGRDRPGTTRSGYGGKGATAASRIDLIAGMASSFPHKDGTFGPPCSGTIVNPNFAMDAARVYISQKSDLDRYMGLAEVDGQAPPGRSGIGLKADTIRIHARQDIKIVTGRARVQGAGRFGERLSTGGVNDVVGTISLIAGNYTDDDEGFITSLFNPKNPPVIMARKKLQPIPRGDNLVECIEDLIDTMAEVLSLVGQNSGFIQQMSMDLLGHIHTGPSGPVSPPLVFDRLTGLKPIPPVVFFQSAATKTSKVLLSTKLNSTLKLNHLSKLGSNYINSKFVFTT